MAELESIQNKYLDGRSIPNCSEETRTQLDNEVIDTLKTAHNKALSLLKENREALNKISEFLIEKETITGDEFMKILNDVQGKAEIPAADEGIPLPESVDETALPETEA